MKKLLKKNKSKKELPARITNDTIAEHREKVLAKGRRHKYPVQYTKHRLVWVTAIVSFIVLILFAAAVWLQLYVWRDTGDLAYRIVRIAPLPVASIDGEQAKYSDYLLYHRSTLAVLKSQGQADQKDKVKFYQQQSIDKALEVAYAQKLAREQNVSIDENKIHDLMKQQREASKLSEAAYESVVSDNLHWSMEELITAMRYTLLKQEVSFAVDKEAKEISDQVAEKISSGVSLSDIANELGSKVQFVPDLPVSKNNADGGLTKAALALEKGKTSGVIKTLSGDGYYYVTLNSTENDTVNYSYIKIPLNAFRQQFNDLKKNNKVTYYISIES